MFLLLGPAMVLVVFIGDMCVWWLNAGSIQALIPLTCTLARMMGWNGLSAKRKDQPFRYSYITVHVVHKYLCIWMIHHCEDQNWTALCEGPIDEYLSTDIGYSDEPPRRYIWLGFQYPNHYDIKNHSEGWMRNQRSTAKSYGLSSLIITDTI